MDSPHDGDERQLAKHMAVNRTADIRIRHVNASWIGIDAPDSIKHELSDYYTFEVPGAAHMPGGRWSKSSRGHWDGKIRLYNKRDSLLPRGLLEELKSNFAGKFRYTTSETDDSLKHSNPRQIDRDSIKSFIDDLDICDAHGRRIVPREDQLDAIEHGLRERRSLILSPTASGKTLIGYVIFQYLRAEAHLSVLSTPSAKRNGNDSGIRGLVLVPRIQLVGQLISDWCVFSSRLKGPLALTEKDFFSIYGGSGNDAARINQGHQLVVSTWQSLYKLPPHLFGQFNLVIGDEAHEFKAKSLTTIMNACVNAHDRVGLTGTLDGTDTNKMVLEGLFGRPRQIITSRELMDKGHIAKLQPIKIMLLKHADVDCKALKKQQGGYEEEIKHLISSTSRNKFISNLGLSLKGNSLILFVRVEAHGQLLYDMMRTADPTRKVFFIHGKVDTDVREDVRRIVEAETNAIIVASYGTFSTGINIRNIHNVVFASPSKSRVRNLQSIGRGLRIGDSKTEATLFDIADDLRPASKGAANFTYSHLIERMKIYVEQKFPYKIYDIELPPNNITTTSSSLLTNEAFETDDE